MLELNRGHSFVAYSYDGAGPLSFVLPFPYLEKTHIRAFIGEGASATPIAFSWVSSNTVSIQDPAVAVPYTVTLRRVTPIEASLVDFQDGARLPAADLNRSALQLLFLLQERHDFGDGGTSTPSALPGGLTPAWSIENLVNQVVNSTAMQTIIGSGNTYEDLAEAVLGATERTDLIYADGRAFAQQLLDLTAASNGNYANIQQRFVAMANGTADPGGEWEALYSLKLTGQTAGGSPVVAGIGLGINPATGSEFVVSADRFAIVNPNYAANGGDNIPKVPFVVGTVNGVSTVGITGQLVVDGSINATKLSVGSLSAISANMGTVNGGTFKTHTLNASGGIIDPTEFRVEVTNAAGDFPLWIGSGTKTANNAIFYVQADGSAKFAGQVSAPNIVGQLQAATILNRGSTPEGLNTPPTQLTTVDSWTFPAPLRPGETHGIIGTITVKLGELREPTVILEYLDGSVWTELSRAETGDVTGSNDAFVITNSLTLSFALPSRSTATDFRLRLYYLAQNTIQTRYKGTTGFIMGVR